MDFKIQATNQGLIKIKPSIIINIKRPNSLSATKFSSEPLILNVCTIVFLAYNNDGNVTYFLSNNIELSLNLFYQDAIDIFSAAMSRNNLEI